MASKDELEKRIKEVIEIAQDAQQDWACVTKTYAPDWTHPFKAILDILEGEGIR